MRTLLARGHPDAPAAAWFTGLALIVVGPLLGTGYLFLLDWVSGPHFPRLRFVAPPSGWILGNAAPLNLVHVALTTMHPYLPDKLFLLTPVFIGGLGLYRFARVRMGTAAGPALVGGTLFVVNPFVIDRYLAGHLLFLLGYALLPWALAPVFDGIRQLSTRAVIRVSLWLLILSVADVHAAGLYAMLAVVGLMFARSPARVAYAAAALGLGAVLSSYWLLPALLAPPAGGIDAADLALYASRPQGFLVLPTLLGMYGFWRDEFLGPAQQIPALYLLLIPILGLVVAGLVRLLRLGPYRRFTAALSVTAVIALLLAGGTSFPPTAPVFRSLFDHVFFFRLYREPQKFLALVLLAYGVFIAVGLDGLARPPLRATSRLSFALSYGGVAVVLAYGFTMLWGLGGQVHLSRYPDEWVRAEGLMREAESGRLLVVPWHRFAVWSFSDGRIVASPAISFFSPEVLTSDEAGFASAPLQSSDPFSRYVSDLLAHRREVRWFGHLVAPLGIRYVAWLQEVDPGEYKFLEWQRDLEPLYRGERLVLFENTAWRGGTYGVGHGEPIGAPSELLGSDWERSVTERFYEAPSLVTPVRDSFARFVTPLAVARPVSAPGGSPFILVGERCTDGWTLGDASSRCHLGAVAGFPNPSSPEPLRLPLSGLTLFGYIATAMGLTTVAILWRTSLPARNSSAGRREATALSWRP